MLYLNYDNLPEEFEIMTFPGGEPHVKIPVIEGYEVFLRAEIRGFEDMGYVMALLNAIKSQNKYVYLFLPYFPGARQDRNPGGTTPLTVDMYAKMLQPYVDMLIVFDIHSSGAVHYIARHFGQTRFHQPFELPQGSFGVNEVAGIIAPDKGAITRAQGVAHAHFNDCPVVFAEKQRDFNSGHITGYHLHSLPAPGIWLVIDDICDGGWTFNELAKAFSQDPVSADSELWLYVSHGIFSKGFDNISPQYTKIFTTDSWLYPAFATHDRLNIIPLNWIETLYIS